MPNFLIKFNGAFQQFVDFHFSLILCLLLNFIQPSPVWEGAEVVIHKISHQNNAARIKRYFYSQSFFETTCNKLQCLLPFTTLGNSTPILMSHYPSEAPVNFTCGFQKTLALKIPINSSCFIVVKNSVNNNLSPFPDWIVIIV